MVKEHDFFLILRLGAWLIVRFLQPNVKKALSLKFGGILGFKSSCMLIGFEFYCKALETVTLLTLYLFVVLFAFLLVINLFFLVSIGLTVYICCYFMSLNSSIKKLLALKSNASAKFDIWGSNPYSIIFLNVHMVPSNLYSWFFNSIFRKYSIYFMYFSFWNSYL